MQFYANKLIPCPIFPHAFPFHPGNGQPRPRPAPCHFHQLLHLHRVRSQGRREVLFDFSIFSFYVLANVAFYAGTSPEELLESKAIAVTVGVFGGCLSIIYSQRRVNQKGTQNFT